MTGTKLLPCPFCGIELYACTEGWSGGTRYAHEDNGCSLSRKFVQGPEQEEAWNRRAIEADLLAALKGFNVTEQNIMAGTADSLTIRVPIAVVQAAVAAIARAEATQND